MPTPRAVPRPLRRAALVLALPVAAVFSSACDDDPYGFNDWQESPDTVFLYSLARPELNLPSAFDMNARRLIRVEAAGSTGNWDFLLNTVDGGLVFVTPTAVGLQTHAGIATIDDETFESIRRAPGDTARYVRAEAVPVRLGQLYVVRTNYRTGSFGARCTYYGKLEPLEVDVVGGTLRFRFDVNPICNSRDLVPPED